MFVKQANEQRLKQLPLLIAKIMQTQPAKLQKKQHARVYFFTIYSSIA